MEHDHNYCAKIPDEENNEVPGEEEEMTGESQDGQVPDLGGLTSHSDLTPDQIAFVVTKSLKYKDLKRQWTKVFKRAPPSRCTVDRHRRRFRETNSIKNRRTGRKPSVRTPEMIAEVKRVLEEESDASPNQFVNRARNNQWGGGINRGTFLNIMKDIKFRPYVPCRHQILNTANTARRLEFAQKMSQKPLEYCQDMIVTGWNSLHIS